jgi:hypothetical protein
MAQYCLGKIKGTVIVKNIDGSVYERISSKNPPLEVTVTNSQSAVTGAGLDVDGCGQLNNYGTYYFNGYAELRPTTYQGCSGLQLYLNGVNQGDQEIFHPSAVITQQASCNLLIKDSQNNILFNQTTQRCLPFDVACDDQCPAGQIRTPTIEYPGYKCREKCPPETACECDCGDVICCYGSQGQVLKTIPK